jgi:hypothetical protein
MVLLNFRAMRRFFAAVVHLIDLAGRHEKL